MIETGGLIGKWETVPFVEDDLELNRRLAASGGPVSAGRPGSSTLSGAPWEDDAAAAVRPTPGARRQHRVFYTVAFFV